MLPVVYSRPFDPAPIGRALGAVLRAARRPAWAGACALSMALGCSTQSGHEDPKPPPFKPASGAEAPPNPSGPAKPLASGRGDQSGTPETALPERGVDAAAREKPTSIPRPPVREPTSWSAERASPSERMRQARERLPVVRQLFDEAGAAFPAEVLLLRGFKKEGELEVWAGAKPGAPLTHVTTYGFCYASGELGPKRVSGDRQVPEGFYRIGYVNSASAFHLSMQVSYPNPSDRILGHPRNPGSDIMIHGNCVSIGCISLGDERIEELWTIVTSMPRWQRRARVHLYPSRDMAGLLASGAHPEHHAFWRNLKEVYDFFFNDRSIT